MQTQPTQEQPAQEEPLQQGEVQATEQEQQQLESLYAEALNMIHAPGKVGDQINEMVIGDDNVSRGIGRATATVLIGVEKKLGAPIPDEMKWQLGLEIIAELSGLAVTAGALAEDEIGDNFIDETVSHAYTSYLQTKETMGELDPRELEQSVAEAEQLVGTSVRSNQPRQAPQEQAPQQQQPQGGLMQML